MVSIVMEFSQATSQLSSKGFFGGVKKEIIILYVCLVLNVVNQLLKYCLSVSVAQC